MENTNKETVEAIQFDVKKQKKLDKANKITKNVVAYVFLTICSIFAFLPFYWMIISSLKSEKEFRSSVPTFFPHTFQFKNYSFVLQSDNGLFGQDLINTLIVGLFSTVMGVIITILTAYALAKVDFKGKNALFSLMLATMMIPGELYTTTNYITVGKNGFGWNNTLVVLIIPFLVSVYYIYLLRNAFKQIPDSLYQAAKVDGTSEMGYLVKVMVPLTAPTLVSITLLKFIGTWNSYIWPRLVNKDNKWQLVTNWVTKGFADQKGVLGVASGEALTTLKMAAVCMVSAPLFVLFLTCRKYIMNGVSRSGTKG